MTEKKKGGKPKKVTQMGRPTFYGETMRDVVLRMTDKQNSWLLSEATKRGISKAQLVRDLVDKEMKA